MDKVAIKKEKNVTMIIKPTFLHNNVDKMMRNIIMAAARYICEYDRSIYVPDGICLYISAYSMDIVEINNERVMDLYKVYKNINKLSRFEMIYVQAGLRGLWQKYNIPHKPFKKPRHGVDFGDEFNF